MTQDEALADVRAGKMTLDQYDFTCIENGWDFNKEPISTWYSFRGGGEWPFTETGWAIHRVDLADLGEPYLSAVKQARGVR